MSLNCCSLWDKSEWWDWPQRLKKLFTRSSNVAKEAINNSRHLKNYNLINIRLIPIITLNQIVLRSKCWQSLLNFGRNWLQHYKMIDRNDYKTIKPIDIFWLFLFLLIFILILLTLLIIEINLVGNINLPYQITVPNYVYQKDFTLYE